MLGMWDVGDVGCWGCGMLGMWDVGDVGCSGCGMFGMWDVRDVGCAGCGMFGMWDIFHIFFVTGSNYWDILVSISLMHETAVELSVNTFIWNL